MHTRNSIPFCHTRQHNASSSPPAFGPLSPVRDWSGLACALRSCHAGQSVQRIVCDAQTLSVLSTAGVARCGGQHGAWRGDQRQSPRIWDVFARRRGAAQGTFTAHMALLRGIIWPRHVGPSTKAAPCVSANCPPAQTASATCHISRCNHRCRSHCCCSRPRLPRPACTRRTPRAASPRPPPHVTTTKPRTWSPTWRDDSHCHLLMLHQCSYAAIWLASQCLLPRERGSIRLHSPASLKHESASATVQIRSMDAHVCMIASKFMGSYEWT